MRRLAMYTVIILILCCLGWFVFAMAQFMYRVTYHWFLDDMVRHTIHEIVKGEALR